MSIKALSLKPTMTVKEVSEILNVSDKHVRVIVSRIFPDKMVNGKTTYLNESEVTAVKLEIEKNPHLNRSVQVKTDLEKKILIKQGYDLLMEEITNLQEENKDLKMKIYEDKPKLELANAALRDQSKHYSIRDAGKHLGLSQSEIFKILRNKSMLTSKNLPSQNAIATKILTLRTNVVGNKNIPQAIMTMENIDNFRKRYL